MSLSTSFQRNSLTKPINISRCAPWTALSSALTENWERAYTRETASRPAPWLKRHKVWPSVNRIDNVHGQRNLVCSCPSIEIYMK